MDDTPVHFDKPTGEPVRDGCSKIIVVGPDARPTASATLVDVAETTTADEQKLLRDLEQLAAAYEAKALQLRRAASVLRETPVGSVVTASGVVHHATASGTALFDGTASGTKGSPSADDYLRMVRSLPGMTWEAGSLSQVMQQRGYDVSYEAARTQLYRMQARHQVTKIGRGRWALTTEQQRLGLSGTGQPGRTEEEESGEVVAQAHHQ